MTLIRHMGIAVPTIATSRQRFLHNDSTSSSHPRPHQRDILSAMRQWLQNMRRDKNNHNSVDGWNGDGAFANQMWMAFIPPTPPAPLHRHPTFHTHTRHSGHLPRNNRTLRL